jgi:hypothetical protein|tara:strand:- start:192 stop:506 length:315 start_codon:yes stop_codon:yes gene_type:complete
MVATVVVRTIKARKNARVMMGLGVQTMYPTLKTLRADLGCARWGKRGSGFHRGQPLAWDWQNVPIWAIANGQLESAHVTLILRVPRANGWAAQNLAVAMGNACP